MIYNGDSVPLYDDDIEKPLYSSCYAELSGFILSLFQKWDSKWTMSLWRGMVQRPITNPSEIPLCLFRTSLLKNIWCKVEPIGSTFPFSIVR